MCICVYCLIDMWICKYRFTCLVFPMFPLCDRPYCTVLHNQVRLLLGSLTAKIQTHPLDPQAVGNALYGLCRWASCSNLVKHLVKHLV